MYNESNVAVVSVDGVEFKTSFKRDFNGYDLEFFGDDNKWSDGKHYAGIMSCLRMCDEENLKSYKTERKGSIYSVTLSA